MFDAHIAVNLKAPFFLMQAVVADLVARKAPGTIVNIGSTSAYAGQPYPAPYVAAKAGLAGLTRNAARAHRRDRIRINGLCGVRTLWRQWTRGPRREAGRGGR